MNASQRVHNCILGKETDRQPIYGWVSENLSREISEVFGSVANFEDRYEFDAAHIFGGPWSFDGDTFDSIRAKHEELTPDVLLDYDLFTSPDKLSDYDNIARSIEHHKKRDRFCYVQTPGFFEHFNTVFGIEDQLLYLALYPEELGELYKRQAEWTLRFAEHCIDLGADMIHLSDDWGSQKDMLFSPKTWKNLIAPNVKTVADFVHGKNRFVSLHSDGCIAKVTDGIADIGLDVLHPWQENAGMPLSMYLDKYADRFGLMGGICVQSALGIMNREDLEKEIRRVFGLLKGKRWICCTSHFVQKHCTMEDLIFAYDLIYKLARE
ncbi:MAG: hypothetical protein E7523_04900 [Ruminococcaceae bacterium]|nr:hypothetical protein [Oscillospiraceae bacterium]